MFVNRWKLTMGFWGPLRLGEYLQGEERKEEKEKKEEEVVEVLEGEVRGREGEEEVKHSI